MKYTKLGKSDLNVSKVCLGCMGFGNPQTGQHSWTVSEEDTRSIIKCALDLPICRPFVYKYFHLCVP